MSLVIALALRKMAVIGADRRSIAFSDRVRLWRRSFTPD